MGIGAMIVRGIMVTGAGGLLYAAVLNPIMDRINPKPLSIEERKDAAGNIEHYLKYKSEEGYALLPCAKGPNGPLCGTVDYWWQSIGAGQREGLAVGEWPSISNDAKHGILSSELQTLVDAAYGTQNGSQKTPAQQQYNTPKK